MDKEHVKGAAKDIQGSIKKGIGKATGDKRLEADGAIDKAEGAVRKTAGDVKDAVKKADKGRM